MATTLAYNVMLGLFKHVGHVHTAPVHNNAALPVHHKQVDNHATGYNDNRAAAMA
jgi:hypothetical protein